MAALLLVAVATVRAQDDPASRLRGQALFRGEAPLHGRVYGHAIDLPSTASRCVNCHESTARSEAATARAAVNSGIAQARQPLSPALGGAWLTQLRSRRSGPASRFDAAALCTLLRTGIDPAQIVISTGMPRYQVTDAQCTDLWSYLLSKP